MIPSYDPQEEVVVIKFQAHKHTSPLLLLCKRPRPKLCSIPPNVQILPQNLLACKKHVKVKVKQSHYRPGGFQKLRFTDFVMTQDGGRLSALHTSCLYPQEMLLVLISVRVRVYPRAIV